MPSKCASASCSKKASIQATMPGATTYSYFCSLAHAAIEGAVQTQNKKQRVSNTHKKQTSGANSASASLRASSSDTPAGPGVDEEHQHRIGKRGACPTAPQAFAGYSIVNDCPELNTLQQRHKMIGKTILHAFDDSTACGWFVGKVVGGRDMFSQKERRELTKAEFVVEYKRSETGVKRLHGRVASDLCLATFGVNNWWLLLEEDSSSSEDTVHASSSSASPRKLQQQGHLQQQRKKKKGAKGLEGPAEEGADGASLRKRNGGLDYSILGGKWGSPVTSRIFRDDKTSAESNASGLKTVFKHSGMAVGGAGAKGGVPKAKGDMSKDASVGSTSKEGVCDRGAGHNDTGGEVSGNSRGKRKKGKHGMGSDGGGEGAEMSSSKAAMALRVRIKSKLSQARYCESMLEAYQQEGWGGRGHRQLKPTAELAKCAQQLVEIKKSVRSLLQALDPHVKTSRISANDIRISECAYDADGVEVDKVQCAYCGTGDSCDGNDILLCDFNNCNRAYHQKCHDPPLPDLPHEDEDWFCSHCFCYSDCIEAVNEQFDTSHVSQRTMFSEICGDSAANAGEEEEEYLSEEDDDYAPNVELEIASDDDRSVHTESAEESESEDDSPSHSDDGDDGEEQEKEGKGSCEGSSSKGKRKAAGGGLLMKLMSMASPPSSPKQRKRAKSTGAKGKDTSTSGIDKGKDTGRAQEDATDARGGGAMLSAFYASWDPEYGYVDDSDDDDEYDPDMSSDEDENGDKDKEKGGSAKCKGKGAATNNTSGPSRSMRASATKALEYFASLPE